MHRTQARIPSVVAIILSLANQSAPIRQENILISNKILHLDLRADPLAIELEDPVLIAGERRDLPIPGIDRAAEERLPVLWWFGSEGDPADRPGIRVAYHMPFAVFRLWAILHLLEDRSGI